MNACDPVVAPIPLDTDEMTGDAYDRVAVLVGLDWLSTVTTPLSPAPVPGAPTHVIVVSAVVTLHREAAYAPDLYVNVMCPPAPDATGPKLEPITKNVLPPLVASVGEAVPPPTSRNAEMEGATKFKLPVLMMLS